MNNDSDDNLYAENLQNRVKILQGIDYVQMMPYTNAQSQP